MNPQPNNNNLKYALRYAKQNWPVLPIHSVMSGKCSCGKANCSSAGKHPMTRNGVKDATTDRRKIKEWFRRWPDFNIGIRTGIESDLIVLDVDPRNRGIESLEKLIAEYGKLPLTIKVKTGNGFHFYFRYPDLSKKFKCATNFAGYTGLDLKAQGGYVIAPPSNHLSGNKYRFIKKKTPRDREAARFPKAMLHLLESKNTKDLLKTKPTVESSKITKGARNDRLTSFAGVLLYRGFELDEITPLLLKKNEKYCDPPLPPEEVKRIVQSISRYSKNKKYPYTDSGNAERFVDLFGEDFLFCKDLEGWLAWDGSRWIVDRTMRVKALSKTCARLMYEEAKKDE
ncbi:MAG: DNA primase [Nitrospina sp.]|jgi:putative DNA primase/helicase|nr:DNA primase [Nitrospina sp.]